MDLNDRVAVHAALGDAARLRIVDELLLGDRTFQELVASSGVASNLAAHHLGVLEDAGLISRRQSDGDHRRRYISLRYEQLDAATLAPSAAKLGFVVFVCTHNSARSQFASALWTAKTGGDADSAGTEPAPRVHPLAIEVAGEFGVDLHGKTPKSIGAVHQRPDLVISVCDRARESGAALSSPALHWSIPDPVSDGDVAAFRAAFTEIAARVGRLADARQH